MTTQELIKRIEEEERLKMIRKRDINDWLLWLMVFRIYMDLYGWKSLLLCLVGAVALFVANKVVDRRIGVKK